VRRYTGFMWRKVRAAALYFLVGFTIAFLVYLFVRFDPGEVLIGIAIGAGAGIVLAAILLWLEHRYPDRPDYP
jgi:multisubunit Na+/H+ antiporter MnhE subunit